MSPDHAPLNLEQLRKQAKELLKAVRTGDSAALARVAAVHPDSIDASSAKLAHAQLVIARENGYASWPKLVANIGASRAPATLRPFEKDIQYYADRADGLVSAFGDSPEEVGRQISAGHPRFSGASAQDIRNAGFHPEDARLVVAREHGCDSWETFRDRIEALARGEARDSFAEAFEAVKAGDAERLLGLLEAGPELARAAGTNHTTLLNLAVSCKQIECVMALITAGADVDAGNRYGVTPLHQAAYAGSLELAEILLRAEARTDLNARGEGGTPLMQALFWGHAEVANRLAEAGVVPLNLRVAAGLGRLDLIEELFDEAGRPTMEAGRSRAYYRPHPGFPPWKPSDDAQEIVDEALVYACKSGRIAAMDALVKRGANVNAVPYNGTGMMWAAHTGRRDAALWLLARGSVPDRVANFGGVRGLTALQVAAWSGRLEIVKLLVEHGASVHLRDPVYHGFAWGWANFHGHKEVAEWLAELGSRENIFYAVVGRRLDRVEALLERDPSLANLFDGWTTPLVDAASRGFTEIVRTLLAAGADHAGRNAEGKTGVEAALAAGHEETAEAIRGCAGSG